MSAIAGQVDCPARISSILVRSNASISGVVKARAAECEVRGTNSPTPRRRSNSAATLATVTCPRPMRSASARSVRSSITADRSMPRSFARWTASRVDVFNKFVKLTGFLTNPRASAWATTCCGWFPCSRASAR